MYRLSARELRDAFVKGELSAEKIAEATLQRIARHDPSIQAFISLLSDRALEKAKELDVKRKKGESLGKLAGVPVAIKDNILVRDSVTTCASKFLAHYKAPFSATVVDSLEAEGAVIIGKANLDEFAMGSSTENSAFFPTKNPWDLSCSPGGSSGGAASLVAARLSPLALGSDTGGSIRQPAALTGIVGYKPTYGRVSRHGLVAFASSLDQIGPLSTNVADAALVMEVIGRHCSKDATSLPLEPMPYLGMLERPLPSKVIGVPWHFLEGLSDEMRANFDSVLSTFKDLGYTLVDVDLDLQRLSVAVYYIIATAEASTNLARFDGIRYGTRSTRAKTLEEVYRFSRQEGFGPEVKKRILLGTYVLSSGYLDAYYKKAQQVRSLMIAQFKQAFSKCALILLPSAPTAAFALGSFQDPLAMYLQDLYTIGANLAGLPAISVPSGFTKEGKPLGVQLLGPQMEDSSVLAAAHAFESTHAYAQMIPPLFTDGTI